jgi:hypothetical protein
MLVVLALGAGPGPRSARGESVGAAAAPDVAARPARWPVPASQPERRFATAPEVSAAATPRPVPASQPVRRFAAFEERARPVGPVVDLELRRAPLEGEPRFRPVRPFAEMLAYHTFLVGAGWLYGHSPLDWDPPSWDRWWYNVSNAPVNPDGDVWWLNWSHAVFGSDHYLMARNSGWSWWSAALFCNFGSLTWEYVTEGIFEQPSLVDLIATPILGSLLGEARYRAYRLVRRWAGDRWYGRVAMGVLDPTTTVFELAGW